MPNDNAAPQSQQLPATFTPAQAFDLAAREAKVYASSTLVPTDYQGNPANCLIALNMAKRIGVDPLMTMQNLYIVHGRPGWSAQFLIGAFNQCGRFTAMRFEWKGVKETADDYGCRAYATELATKEKIVGPWVTWKMVRAEGWDAKKGSKWQTIPDLMFQYRAAAWFVRTHAPEIAMGHQTVEELRDMGDPIDVTEDGSAQIVSATERAKQAVAAALAPAPADSAPVVDKATGEVIEQRPGLELDGASGPGPTYAEVREQIDKAKNADALDQAQSLVDSLPQHFRAELHELAKARRASLGA